MKYIIEIAKEYEEYFKGILICGIADGKFAVDVIAREDLEELNSDYINEHFGELQDEAYRKGYEDGKKSVSDPDRIEVGDEVEDSDGDKTIVTNIHGNLFDGLCSDGSVMGDLFLDDNHKTGKHYDIASILEAMRNDR
jgi:hypothetical protein